MYACMQIFATGKQLLQSTGQSPDNIQMTHDGNCDMLKYIYVPKLKCQHYGQARVLTFQLRDIYICMSHESIMHHCKSHALIGWDTAVGVASRSWHDIIMSWLLYGFVPVKCKFLILFNRILVSDATKQMMHDGLMWHANIYVPQLKCQHSGFALVLTFRLRDIYILACHTCHHVSFV